MKESGIGKTDRLKKAGQREGVMSEGEWGERSLRLVGSQQWACPSLRPIDHNLPAVLAETVNNITLAF